MRFMRFTIINILKSKSLDGHTHYEAKEDDGTIVGVLLPNMVKVTNDILYERFTTVYKLKKIEEQSFNIGDVIEVKNYD